MISGRAGRTPQDFSMDAGSRESRAATCKEDLQVRTEGNGCGVAWIGETNRQAIFDGCPCRAVTRVTGHHCASRRRDLRHWASPRAISALRCGVTRHGPATPLDSTHSEKRPYAPPPGRVGSILWRSGTVRDQKGSDQSASRVRTAERGSAGQECLASNCRSLSHSRLERAREATGGSKGHAVESGRDCLCLSGGGSYPMPASLLVHQRSGGLYAAGR